MFKKIIIWKKYKMIDIQTTWVIVSTVFTASWVLLKIIAPYTKTDKDDKLVKIITKLMKVFSINIEDKKLEITIKPGKKQ